MKESDYSDLERARISLGRVQRKLEKVKKQRDAYWEQLLHFKYVLDICPYIMSRHERYEERKKEHERVKAQDKRVIEQEQLIILLRKENERLQKLVDNAKTM